MTNYSPIHQTIIPAGRFRGQTIDEAASTDRGLVYLDWLLGQLKPYSNFARKLSAYLHDPAIAKDLDDLLETKKNDDHVF